MDGEIIDGLYRLKEGDRFRFFRIYRTSDDELVVKEYREGNLHQMIEEHRGQFASSLAFSLWPKLQPWQ